ncbi:MAG TPA: hypothetical protein VK619_15580 [Pyrinomonadaceae bacterium]|nr:hypothetical protein [Pyrinomonadaceae bacterium]
MIFYSTTLMTSFRRPFRIIAPSLLYAILSMTAFLFPAGAQNSGPLLERCAPRRGAVNSVLELEGYRLSAEDTSKVKAYFIRGSVKLTARIGGSHYVTNDLRGGEQSLEVIVPEDVAPGQWQVLVEVYGQRSAPVAVEIAEWEPPLLDHLTPERVGPGELIWVFGTNFHRDDEIEITDSLGNVHRFDSGASAQDVAFDVPKNMPEGSATVRVGITREGVGSFSQPLSFVVTSGPVPLELWSNGMKPVAPGQWANLVVTSTEPLEHSERTEVEFSQNGQHLVVETLNPRSLHVHVPAALAPGAVELRTRTWQEGLVSDWSKTIAYKLSEHPVPFQVDVIEVRNKPVFLWEGPDRPTSFAAHPGDTLIFRGDFTVATADDLRITLDGAGGQLSFMPVDVEAGVSITLPHNIRRGDWRFTFLETDNGMRARVPVVMRVD